MKIGNSPKDTPKPSSSARSLCPSRRLASGGESLTFRARTELAVTNYRVPTSDAVVLRRKIWFMEK
jgi:hypothetical protein